MTAPNQTDCQRRQRTPWCGRDLLDRLRNSTELLRRTGRSFKPASKRDSSCRDLRLSKEVGRHRAPPPPEEEPKTVPTNEGAQQVDAVGGWNLALERAADRRLSASVDQEIADRERHMWAARILMFAESLVEDF